ncbi:MAG TPA: hypothetical protein VF786_04050, partial [Terriglobales bacterium]
GRYDDAKKALDEAVAVARENKNDMYEAQALTFEGERLSCQGDVKGARALYEQAMPPALRSKDQETMLLAKLAVARWTVENGNARSESSDLKRISQSADAQGLSYISMRASVLSAEASLKSKDFSSASTQAEAVRRASEKLGFLFINARARYVQAEAMAAAGKSTEASQQYAQAKQILQDIGKESQSQSFMKRSDLQPMLAH